MKTGGLIRIGTIILSFAHTVFIPGDAYAQVSPAPPKHPALAGNVQRPRTFREDAHSLNSFLLAPFESLASLASKGSEDSLFLFGHGKGEGDDISFRTTSFRYPGNSKADVGIAEFPTDLLVVYARALKRYARKNGFDTSYAFLTNMGMLCNKKRFFVVNLTTMKIEKAGLVSHGRGQGPSIYDKQYSDERGSRCTSLGRYKILKQYRGGYGDSYRLTGLDSSNHNAFDRNIVLHSMHCIPDAENLFPACVSDGCPAVSAKFLSTLRKIIDSRKKPMLLWIFDSNLQRPELNPFPEPIRIEYYCTTKNSFDIAMDHCDNRLRAITHKPTRGHAFQWLRGKKRKNLPARSADAAATGLIAYH